MLKLFTTSHCHLCEVAYALVLQHYDANKLQCIEIADNAILLDAYGLHIPVLQRTDTMAELYWPFDYEDIQRFLGA